MDSEGEFVGFIGAQAVTISAWQILWRKLQTDDGEGDESEEVDGVDDDMIMKLLGVDDY